MSFFNSKYANLVPYTPGEQAAAEKIIKLNTNESPYPPAPGVKEAAAKAAAALQRYSDPSCLEVIRPLAKQLQVQPEEICVGNGSDEILSFIFQGFTEYGVLFPDVTYGFYHVFSQLFQVESQAVPLNEQLQIDLAAYPPGRSTVVIANPNAPTGLVLAAPQIGQFLEAQPQRLVVIDEAYIDFGGASMVPFINQYPNLLVVGTFSKSRQLAGARLGYAVGNERLIADLNRLGFSLNPYNVNQMTLACGAAVLAEQDYVEACIAKTVATREWTKTAMKELGFQVTDSRGNFIFVRHPRLSGQQLFQALRQQQILTRWFNQPRIVDYLRISVGTKAEMAALVAAVAAILAALPQ